MREQHFANAPANPTAEIKGTTNQQNPYDIIRQQPEESKVNRIASERRARNAAPASGNDKATSSQAVLPYDMQRHGRGKAKDQSDNWVD